MILTSNTFPSLLGLCIRHLLTGEIHSCAAILDKVFTISPNESAFRLLHAVCNHRSKRFDELPKPAPTQTIPDFIRHETNLEPQQHALQRLENEISTDPLNPTPYYTLALMYERLGRQEEASRAYVIIVTLEPHALKAYEGLLRCYTHLGRISEAMQTVIRCEHLPSAQGQWLAGAADILRQGNQLELAKRLYRSALSKLDDSSGMPVSLLLAELEQKDKNYANSEAILLQALRVAPNEYALQRELINLHLSLGNLLSAKKWTDEFFTRNPRSLGLFFAKVSLELQPVYASEQGIERARVAVMEGLRVIKGSLPSIPERIIADFDNLITSLNSFYLAYHGQSVLQIQKEFAHICQQALHRALPPPSLPPRLPIAGRKIRVGFLSAYFRDHSNYKIPIKGWLEGIDRESFEIFGYHLSDLVDSKTEEASRLCDRFVQGPLSLKQWIDTIQDDKLDVLIFPEIGMDPTCRKIACYRLAPVQVNSWGHPVTSGLSTIDYFLSSELMEGPESDSEYTEKLIRLPRLSINYKPPHRTLLPLQRPHFGLRDDAVALWCCQVIYKHLPQFDWVYAEIATRLPHSQFVFITIQSNSEPAQLFKKRLTSAFETKGLNPEHHLLFLSSLKADEFATVASLCDLSLDAFEWSGCNSSLETLAYGTPIVTCPGRFMRGRHTEALLRVLQCEELIAATPQAYIDLVVSLASAPERVQALRDKIRSNIHLAYNDTSCIRELERHLREWASDQAPLLHP